MSADNISKICCAPCNTATHRFYGSEKSTLGCQGNIKFVTSVNLVRLCQITIDAASSESSLTKHRSQKRRLSCSRDYGVKSMSGQGTSARVKKYMGLRCNHAFWPAIII